MSESQERPERQPEAMYNFSVIDIDRSKVGDLARIWLSNDTNEHEFYGVKTGLVHHRVHPVPSLGAEIDRENRAVHLPFRQGQIEQGPSFDDSAELSAADVDKIYEYYGLRSSTNRSSFVNTG